MPHGGLPAQEAPKPENKPRPPKCPPPAHLMKFAKASASSMPSSSMPSCVKSMPSCMKREADCHAVEPPDAKKVRGSVGAAHGAPSMPLKAKAKFPQQAMPVEPGPVIQDGQDGTEAHKDNEQDAMQDQVSDNKACEDMADGHKEKEVDFVDTEKEDTGCKLGAGRKADTGSTVDRDTQEDQADTGRHAQSQPQIPEAAMHKTLDSAETKAKLAHVISETCKPMLMSKTLDSLNALRARRCITYGVPFKPGKE